MSTSPSLSRLHSPFLSSPSIHNCRLLHGASHSSVRLPRRKKALAPVRAVEMDQNTLVAITVGVASVAIGIGIPIFYETQIDSAAKRENTQPCFPCSGSGALQCRFCTGTGKVTVVLGGGETEVSQCINCDGAGTQTCNTCQGTGIQPRYLDRREFKDDD